MNKNALAVLLGLTLMVLGILNAINNEVRALTTTILLLVGLIVLIFAISSDRID